MTGSASLNALRAFDAFAQIAPAVDRLRQARGQSASCAMAIYEYLLERPIDLQGLAPGVLEPRYHQRRTGTMLA